MAPRITMRSGRLRTVHQMMLENSKKNITRVAKMANDSQAMSTFPKKTLATNISEHSKEISQKLASKVPALRCFDDWSADDVAVDNKLHHNGTRLRSRCCRI